MYLSKDKRYLMDKDNTRIAERVVVGSDDYYRTITLESDAYDNMCLETKLLTVCTLWDTQHKCLVWDEVDVCIKAELALKNPIPASNSISIS